MKTTTEDFTLNVSVTIPAEPCSMEGRPRDFHAMNELRGILWAAYCYRVQRKGGKADSEYCGIAHRAHTTLKQIDAPSPKNLTYRPLELGETIQIGDLYFDDPRYLDGRGVSFIVNEDSPSVGEVIKPAGYLRGVFYRRTF